MKRYLWVLLLFFATQTYAQNYQNEFGFKSDNDAYLWYGQDRYYTNGLFINFRHTIDSSKVGGHLEKVSYEISAGQKMFNPISGYRPTPASQDRPFAGYLYGSAGITIASKKENVLKTTLEIGTVGPGALGEEAQDLLHSIVGFYEVQGWEYQIQKAFAINLNAQYIKLLHRSADQKTDFSFDGYATAGTTYSGAGAGILFRAGTINQLFNSASTNQVIGNAKSQKLVEREFFFYAKPQLNYVAYDATVSGSLFENNSPVTFGTKPFVFAQQIGFNYSSKRFTLDYHLIFKSKEIKSTARAHQYGSISMLYRFD